ncbi:hypothetical protein AB0B66_22220 [Catellatospora sp. NPDC049111]|uniref:hypothetical protein n=1 Tax=Catellatospora sp. NPDC049111 TaxID=3155271 RepID=UPI0033E9EC78
MGIAADLDPALPRGPVALAWFDLGRRSDSTGPADPMPTGTSSVGRAVEGAEATTPVTAARPVASSASARAAGSADPTSADTVTNRPAVADRSRTAPAVATTIGYAAHRPTPSRPGQEPAPMEARPATATPSPSPHIFFDVPTSKKMWAAQSDTALTDPEAGSTAAEALSSEQAGTPAFERVKTDDPAIRTDPPRAETTHPDTVRHDAGTAVATTRAPRLCATDQGDAERHSAANPDVGRAPSHDPWTSPFTPAHVVPAARPPAVAGRFAPGEDGPAGGHADGAPAPSVVAAPWPRLTGREPGREQQPGPWPELLDDAELWAVPAPTRTDPDRIRVRQSQQEGRPWNA